MVASELVRITKKNFFFILVGIYKFFIVKIKAKRMRGAGGEENFTHQTRHTNFRRGKVLIIKAKDGSEIEI